MRLHCQEHGYMDEKTGPMAECPYCRIEILEEQLLECRGHSNADKQASRDIIKPLAWACFADNGNIRIWSPDQEPVRKVAEREGWEIIPLFTRQQAVLRVLDAIEDARYTLPDFIIEEIKEKFGA